MDGTRDNDSGEAAAQAGRALGEAAASAAHRVGESLDHGRAALVDAQSMVAECTRECVQSTEAFVRDNPWQAIGIAAGIGMIFGLLLARR